MALRNSCLKTISTRSIFCEIVEKNYFHSVFCLLLDFIKQRLRQSCFFIKIKIISQMIVLHKHELFTAIHCLEHKRKLC